MATLERIYVFDDEGALYSVDLSDFDGISKNAAINVIEELINWTNEEIDKGDEACYSLDELQEHVRELNGLQLNVKRGLIDVSQDDVWHKTGLGFSFASDIL
ncbi:hypothetical protein [Vibrio fluvialis]|uniref:hypothetical protein n=1 Tax=Vibrio fluvialis TaxID=676 RepID=UPI001C9D7E98|nr:hypothetical protein [Vibrio fluvialis]MBY7854391.1 hypothetical protein [Vibrio fluvialis]MBY7902364.1 hypothetical protein [Vibrio fluvialis]MDE5179207.1 hypothetical protein [Vibrio fluvialis]